MLLRLALPQRLALMGIFWTLWVILVLIESTIPARIFPVLISDALGAAAFYTFYQQAPRALKTPFLGLTWGVVLVTIGDLLLVPGEQYFQLFKTLDPISDYVFLAATISTLVGSFSLPYMMEQQGLYPNGRFGVLVAIAALFSSLTVYLISTFDPWMPMLKVLIHAIIVLNFVLYFLQSFLIGGGRIGKQVQIISIALSLVMVGRIIAIIANWNDFSHTLYELLWLTGMSLLLYFAPRKLP